MPGYLASSAIVGTVGVDDNVTSDHIHQLAPYNGKVDVTHLHGAKTNTQPLDNEPANAKGGNLAMGFGMLDWYNRIHVYPTDVALGNLLTSQQRTVSTWNGYVTPVNLNNITSSNTEGVTLTGNFAFPLEYAPLEVKTYTLITDVIGPPSIDASFQFTYSTGQAIIISVTGKRVVVFPFMPQRGVKESLEWKTDIMKAKAGEQRSMIRYEPRQEFEYDFFLDDSQYARWRALSYGWSHRVFAFPVWSEFSRLGPLEAGATTLTFDTASADYRDGDVLILWENDKLFETCEIDAISAGSITLPRATLNTYANVFVAPLRFGRTLSGMQAERDANKLIKGSTTFTVTANTDLSASIGLPTYKSLDVLTDTMYKVGNYAESILRDVILIDNGVASPLVDSRRTFTDQMFTVSWSCRTRAELWRVRKWLHSRKGKAKPFWLPTKLQDFVIAEDATSAASYLRVQPIGYPLYYGIRDIQIMLKNGTVARNRIMVGNADGYGTETLVLESALGIDFTLAQLDYICMMHKVRFDSDRIEINYDEDGIATISVPCIEVPA